MIAEIASTQFLTRQAVRSAWSDHDLIEACLANDQRAWDELVSRYGRLVHSIPRKMRLSPDDSDEVFQSVFLSIHKHLGSLRDRDRLSAWIISMTTRQCYLTIKRVRRDAKGLQSSSSGVRASSDEGIDVNREELRHVVRVALRRLGGQGERLLTALFSEAGNRSYEQIAADLGMKVGSIGPTRARAFEKLEAILHDMGYDALDVVSGSSSRAA